jgi:ubiquinone/menaquinone biosynthesis C-methylase UbiE
MDEADEGLGLVDDDDDATSLSIKSPVFDYIYENGRRYHRFHEGAYPLPNDAAEQHRLKLFHHIWYMLMNSKLCKMPLYDPQMVLDVGCGTGDWAIDMGDCYPSAVVIGTDLSPIQPTWIPPNVRFYVDDAEDEWAFDNHNFDLVHGRMLAGSINNWPRFFEQAFANLRPGGYVEMNELELSFCSDDASPEDIEPLNQIMARYNKASKMFGKSFDDVSSMKQNMQDAGFVDIQKEVYKIPLGNWPANPILKTLGRTALNAAQQSLEPYFLALGARILGESAGDIREVTQALKKEISKSSLHLYIKAHFIWGRKPDL